MPFNYSENKANIGSREKNDVKKQEEIAELRKLLEVKEKELQSPGVEYEKKIERKEAEKESAKEAPEQNFEDLSMARKAPPTALQVKKITKQIKDADAAHQLIILVDLARFKGVYYAVKEAKKIGSAYLLDRLHDAIVNDLFEELVKNKKLRS